MASYICPYSPDVNLIEEQNAVDDTEFKKGTSQEMKAYSSLRNNIVYQF